MIARASTTIDAPVERVWDAFVGAATLVSLSKDNNPTEEAKQHSEKNWRMMLESLKKLMEKTGGQ